MAPKTNTTRTVNNYQGVDTRSRFTLIGGNESNKKFIGYRNREDVTTLDPRYMIRGSQNVLTDVSGRIKSRAGYSLDGQADASLEPMLGWFDWSEHLNTTRNMRGFGGNLQFRYVDSVGTVTWESIITTLPTTSRIRFTNYWNNTEKENVLLFVAGDTNVYEWNGSITTFDSATVNTITKEGTTTWAQDGFYTAGNKKIMIGGIEYTYTAGEGTTTLTGVTPDPTAGGHLAGDLIFQSVVTTANSSITSMDANFVNNLIGNVDNQIYYGSHASNLVYISVVNNYKSVAFTSPVRVVGEGALMTLRAPLVAFEPQEAVMYMSAGKDQWYETKKQLSSDNAKEFFTVVPLKTSAKQGAILQEAVTHDRNSVVIITNEPKLTTLGRVDNIFGTPMMIDYSYPIVNDFNAYDFTDASLKYWKTYIYVAVPKENIFLVLNMTDPTNIFWEAPQTGSFAGFSIINGDLYAHGYSVPETYKMFDTFQDNGHPILSRAVFAYNDYGDRAGTKYFNENWIEGYISGNSILTVKYQFDLDGCGTTITKKVDGNDQQIVCLPPLGDGSLGKTSLGKHGLGTNPVKTVGTQLPPYFNVIQTLPRKDFFKYSPSFESYGADFRWELLSFGPLVTKTMYDQNSIKQ